MKAHDPPTRRGIPRSTVAAWTAVLLTITSLAIGACVARQPLERRVQVDQRPPVRVPEHDRNGFDLVWERVVVEAPPGANLTAVGFGEPGFITFAYVPGEEGRREDDQVLAWVSPDGLSWRSVDQAAFPAAPGTVVQAVTAWDRGFLAVGSVPRSESGSVAAAWVSGDGLAWSRTHLPTTLPVPENELVFASALAYEPVVGRPGAVATVLEELQFDSCKALENRVPEMKVLCVGGEGYREEYSFEGAGSLKIVKGSGLSENGEILYEGTFEELGINPEWFRESGGPASTVWLSPDGHNWGRVTASQGHDSWQIVPWREGFLALAPRSGSFTVLASSDGREWRPVELPRGDLVEAGGIHGLVATDSGLLAYGSTRREETMVWASSDGGDWRKIPLDVHWMAAGEFGVVGLGRNAAWTSADGIGWEEGPLDEAVFQDAIVQAMAAGKDRVVAIAPEVVEGRQGDALALVGIREPSP